MAQDSLIVGGLLIDAAETAEGGEVEEEGRLSAAEKQLFKLAGAGNLLLGEFMSTIGGLAVQTSQALGGEEVSPLEETRFLSAVAFAGKGAGELTPELRSLLEEGLAGAAQAEAERGTGSGLQTGFITEAGGILQGNQGDLDEFVEQRRTALRESLVSGEQDLTVKSFVDQLDDLTNLGANAAQVVTALGNSFKEIGPDIESVGDSLVAAAEIIISSTEAERTVIFKLKEEIASYRNIMEEATTSTEDFTLAEADSIASTDELVIVLNSLKQSQLQQDFVIPSLLNLGDVSQGEVEQILEKAREITQSYLEALTPNEEQQEAIRDTWKATLLQIGDEFQLLDEALPSFAINAAKSSLGFGGAGGGNTFDVRSLNLDSSKRGELDSAYQFIDQLFKQNFPEYEDNIQSLGVIWKDNVTDILHVDNLKLQLAMQQLVDINEKQLEGIYNLPTD